MIRKIKKFEIYYRMNKRDEDTLMRYEGISVYCFKDEISRAEKFSYAEGKLKKHTSERYSLKQMETWNNIAITREEALSLIPVLPLS